MSCVPRSVERRGPARRQLALSSRGLDAQMRWLEQGRDWRIGHRALDDITKLADISPPGVRLQVRRGGATELRRRGSFRAKASDEKAGKGKDVFLSLAKRW